MAEVYKFFNSAPGDEREYYASDFANYFSSVLSAGLLLDENEEYGLQVTLDSGLNVKVAIGKALIKGYSYANTTDLTLTHTLPETEYDRIDRIVLRLDLRNANRYIRAFVKTGAASENPVAPDLQRDQYIYELSLAQVRLRANTASIEASDIIDERALENLCGIVQSLITVPISVFQQQFDAWFDNQKTVYETEIVNWQNQEKADFEAWVASLHDILDGDVAANLANQITTVQQELNEHKTEDATNAKKGHVQLVDDIKGNSTSLVPTQNAVRKGIEQTSYKTVKSGKDANGIFTTVQSYRKSDGTLAEKSVLSGGSSPKYTTRTDTYYGVDGITVEKTETFALTYDADGICISEV